jgi:predicted XRE-type DNA-binding protein
MGRNRNGDVAPSSGNVFADLGLLGAEEKQARVRLALAINQALKERRLSQTRAGTLLDVSQPKISALVNYQLEGFSVERLMRFLNALGRDVEIVVRKKPRSRRNGRVRVTAA